MKCQWKLVKIDLYRTGMPAERCGKEATCQVIRTERGKNLPLCQRHGEDFALIYGDRLPIEDLGVDSQCG